MLNILRAIITLAFVVVAFVIASSGQLAIPYILAFIATAVVIN